MRRKGVYVLVPAIVVAATALAYYGYRYAHEMARRGEQSIVDTTRDIANEKVDRIERLIRENDEAMFNLVDLENLRDFSRRWNDIGPLSPTIESVIVVDKSGRIVPDGYVSKKSAEKADEFRALFESRIVHDLPLRTLQVAFYDHAHREYNGRYYLLAFGRREAKNGTFYIILEVDLDYLVVDVLPDYFAGDEVRRNYQILDEHGAVVYGQRFKPVADK